jgi:hypothetical protein
MANKFNTWAAESVLAADIQARVIQYNSIHNDKPLEVLQGFTFYNPKTNFSFVPAVCIVDRVRKFEKTFFRRLLRILIFLLL